MMMVIVLNMTRKRFVCFKHSITEVALVVETIGEVFAFNMVPDITHTSFSVLFTDCAVVPNVSGFFCNVLIKVFIG